LTPTPILPIVNGPYAGFGPRSFRIKINRIGKKYETCRARACSEIRALKAVALAMYTRERQMTTVATRRRALRGKCRPGWI
jgi:hypothetical protein